MVGARLRLSTPEDEADQQPARSRDGRLVLVGDLRIDNRAELAPTLGLRDELPVPDSAFVLAAYERWTDAFLDHVVGEFALAIVDQNRGGVLLARDHVGQRPLVIHQRRGVVAFGSTALALTALEGVGHALDVERAAEVLALAYSSERTFVQGVRWLAPGSAIWVSDTGLRRWDWWRPDPEEIVDLGSGAAHERELREAFERAVAALIRSRGRTGAGVSGGLDSTSVAATAARRLAPTLLPTYTSAPPPGRSSGARAGWDADESPLVRELAALHPNMSPAFVHLSPGMSIFDLHEPMWELGADPVRNPCNLLWIDAVHRRAASDGVTTLLTGARGNLHFSADGPGWIAALLSARRPTVAYREAEAWRRATGDSRGRIAGRLVLESVPAAAQRVAHAIRRRPSALVTWSAATALRAQILADLDLPRRLPMLDETRRVDPRAVAMWAIQADATQAATFSVLAALTGVEQRDPTSDRRVLETAARQPEWTRRRDGVTRAVVRGAMADRLPPQILLRTRRGEQLPDWLDLMTGARTEVGQELGELERHETSRELIDTTRLRALVSRWPAPGSSADPIVVRDYRLALLRALTVSRYLRWFERRGP